MGGGEASRRRRELARAYGGGAGESWRKGTRWGWVRWAVAFSWAKKVGGPERCGRIQKKIELGCYGHRAEFKDGLQKFFLKFFSRIWVSNQRI
jgi:hypothetical protein